MKFLVLCSTVFLASPFISTAMAASLRADGDNAHNGMSIVPRNLKTMAFMAAMAGTPPNSCRVENGFDYIGNDIGNKPGASADACCDICFSTPNCKAYSWTSQNGGTCWLKSGRGTVVVNANVKSALALPNYEPFVYIEDGIDYVGNDIGNTPMLKPASCHSACVNTLGCRAFTFTTHNGGTCWLKSGRGKMVVNPNAHSAQSYNEDPTCGVEANVDYVGNDIGNVPASKPEDCCGKCQIWEGCRAYSWTNQNGGTCYLKNFKGDVIKKDGVYSSTVRSNPPPPSCALEIGVDYVGNDIGNMPSPDAYGCCSYCLAKNGCKAFSWTNHNGGTCWLKSSKGATAANAGVKSAVV